MASTYSNLGIELIGDGEQSGSWGDTTNDSLQALDAAISQRVEVALTGTTGSVALTDGVASNGRKAYIKFTGALAANNTVTFTPNDLQKIYYIENATTGGFGVIIAQGGGTGDTVAVAPGAIAIVFLDGTGANANVVRLGSYKSGVENSFYVTAGGMFPRLSQQAGGDMTMDDDNAVSGGDTHTDHLEPNITDATISYRAVRTWDFQAASSEFVMFEHQMPADWDGGYLTFMPVWSPDTATSGGVRWLMQAVSYEDGFDWDNGSWSSNQAYVVSTATAAKTIVKGPQSSETSPAINGQFTAGDPAGAGDVVLFSVHRDASSAADTMTGDALLHGMYIFYNQSENCTC